MKLSLGIALGSTAMLLAGCAGTQETVRQAEPTYREGSIVQDQAYIDRVESIARQRGVNVTWVHPPKRRVGEATKP